MNQRLATWLLWLLGVDVPPAGEGVQWQLIGAWRWSRPVIFLCLLAAAVAAAFVVWIYFRERSSAGRGQRLLLAGLRLSLILLVLLVMIFQLQLHFSRTSLPYLALAIDDSASMGLVDPWEEEGVPVPSAPGVPGGDPAAASRLEIVKSWLLADDGWRLRQLARRYNLRPYALAEAERKQSSVPERYLEELGQLQATGPSSQLGRGVRGILNDLRGTQPAALVLFTDGITTQGPSLSEAAQWARRKAVPLHLVAVGSPQKLPGLELADLVVDEIVFVDDYVDFDFTLTAEGLEGRGVELVLRDAAGGEILARREVTAGTDGVPRRQRLSHRPSQVGTVEYVIEVANLQEELPEGRPRLSREIDVRDDPIRVLLVQSTPSFEYRYLKHLLERDRTVQLHVVLQDADLEYAQQDRLALRVFPVSREELFAYDVLILGDVNLGYFTRRAQEQIGAFVTEKGGGLIFISGSQFSPDDWRRSPLAKLLPFDLEQTTVPATEADLREGFAIQPTPLGLTSPHMQLGDSPAETDSLWRDLPQAYWSVEAAQVRSTARVLAEHPTRTGSGGQKLPLIIVAYVPPGKVLWHATDETYRWRYRVGDALFARYWIQAIRYLSRAKLWGQRGVELTADRNTYQAGMPVQLRVRFFDERLSPAADDGVTLLLTGSDPQRRQVKLRRSLESPAIFAATVNHLPLGTYRAGIAAPSLPTPPQPATFQIVAPPGETARREVDTDDLKKAAQISRGEFYQLSELDRLLDQLPPGRPVKVASLPPIPLWNNWRVFTLYLILLTCEWLLRKRAGML